MSYGEFSDGMTFSKFAAMSTVAKREWLDSEEHRFSCIGHSEGCYCCLEALVDIEERANKYLPIAKARGEPVLLVITWNRRLKHEEEFEHDGPLPFWEDLTNDQLHSGNKFLRFHPDGRIEHAWYETRTLDDYVSLYGEGFREEIRKIYEAQPRVLWDVVVAMKGRIEKMVAGEAEARDE